MIDKETYQLIMLATKTINNLAEAMKLYYSLKRKPITSLNAHEKLHIENMETYAEWNSIDL